MAYTQTTLAALRSKAGSLLQKIYTEFGLVKTELDALATYNAAGSKIAKGTLSPGNANAICMAWQNPESSKIIIHRVIVRITAGGGTAGATADFGIVENATITADTLINGLDITAAILADNVTNKGSKGLTMGVVDENGGTNDYITGKILGANAASLAGKYYIFYTVV